jgi:hypothetical protein
MMQNLQPNSKAVEQFFKHLTKNFNADEVIEIRCLKDGFTPNTARFPTHQINEAIKHVVQMNRTHNIYSVVNPVPLDAPKAAKDQDIKRAFFAFVDADDKGAADRARSCDLFLSEFEVVTGLKPHYRNHIYYKFDQPMTNLSEWTELQQLLAAKLETDASIHNPSRIMRVAGTVSYPPKRKVDRGYQTELTRLIVGGSYVE